MAERGRFEGRRAAVTGAGGFIGGAVAAALAREGAAVEGIDLRPRLNAAAAEAGVTPAVADIARPHAADEALAGAELVVHAAAHVREWGSMADFVAVNARGTANVLAAAARAGAARCLQISSVVVFGYDDPAEQHEDAFRRVCGIPYIDTKSASDRLASRRGAVVIRPGDVYGPGSVPWLVRPLELARSGRLAVPSPGDGVMLPVYIDDLVEAVLRGLERGEPGRTYTAWDGRPIRFREYFDRIAAMAGAPPTRAVPGSLLALAGAAEEAWARLRGRPPAFTARAGVFVDRAGTASTERIRSELGWEPRIDLDEGLRRSSEWASAQDLLLAP